MKMEWRTVCDVYLHICNAQFYYFVTIYGPNQSIKHNKII